MAHVTFSATVSTRQVYVDGGHIAERERGHTNGTDAKNCFQLVLVSADVSERSSVSRPRVRCSGQCGQETPRKLLEVLSSMDSSRRSIVNSFHGHPLRAKLSSETIDVLAADSSFHKAR